LGWTALCSLALVPITTGCTSVSDPVPASLSDANRDTAAPADDSGAYDGAAKDDGSGGRTDTPPVEDGGTRITGKVVDAATGRGLAGRTVALAGKKATTNVSGAFGLDIVADSYDVVVTDPDGASVSIFKGLTRREILLPHLPSPNETDAKGATVRGALSGGGDYPLGPFDTFTVYFSSPEASDSLGANAGFGPSYGPMLVRWRGPESITGDLIALRSTFDANHINVEFPGFATRNVTLSTAGSLTANLDLVPVKDAHIAGKVELPAGYSVGYKQVFYRMPSTGDPIFVQLDEDFARSFDYVVPDLSALGGSVCAKVTSSDPLVFTEQCRPNVDGSVWSLAIQSPPALLRPAANGELSEVTLFSWTAFAGGVHVLTLAAATPSRGAPNIVLFTSATGASWSDFSALGLEFPKGSDYTWRVGGVAPLASIDDAFGPDGIGRLTRSESRRSSSEPRNISPPP
jgi:hypothetical protein